MSIPDPIVLLDARARYVHPAFQMSRASSKTVFDSAGRLVTTPANALGWDYDPATGQSRGYLAEPSATNLLLRSNDLTQAAWITFGSSVTGGAITGPDGQGMAKLVEDSTNGNHALRQSFTITDGANVAVSVFAKAGERTRCRLYLQNGDLVSQNVFIDAHLTDGTITGTNEANGATLVDSGVEDLGGGLYRIWLVGNLGTGITNARVELRPLDSSGNTTYQGDGTSGLYVGYGQAEEGSYPTSYIETGASTVTRAVSALRLNSANEMPWWGGERGTFLIDYTLINAAQSGRYFDIVSGELEIRHSNSSLGVIVSGNTVTSQAIMSVSDGSARVRRNIAISMDEDSYSALYNGANLISGDRQSPMPSTVDFRIASTPSTHCHVHRAVYYPQRISNADLQSLTAIQE